jgi:uncharacterized lipoprotein YmbA
VKTPHWVPGLAITAALLAGCGSSPPLRYYDLDAAAPAAPAGHAPGVDLLQVRHVSVPPEMDHRGLTHHQGANQLAISDSDQWSAPLPDLIQAALTRDLGARLGFEHVLAPAAQPLAGRIQAALDLDFVALTADDSCAITAQVNWTLSVPNGPARRGSTQLTGPGAGCPAGLAAALSTALGTLADQLTAQLTSP